MSGGLPGVRGRFGSNCGSTIGSPFALRSGPIGGLAAGAWRGCVNTIGPTPAIGGCHTLRSARVPLAPAVAVIVTVPWAVSLVNVAPDPSSERLIVPALTSKPARDSASWNPSADDCWPAGNSLRNRFAPSETNS
jgi:hypothetical protein